MTKKTMPDAVAILGDTHFGVRNDSHVFLNHQRKFFEEVYFPILKEKNIKYQVQVGDLMDRRQSVNFHTAYEVRKMFFDMSEELDIRGDILVGNHDIYWRQSIEINSWTELFEAEYGHIFNGITKPVTKEIFGVKVDMIPWICKENEQEIIEFIKNSKSDYLFGHLELNGFQMMKGIVNDGGHDEALFSRYKTVFTGHFHTHSFRGNILYTGTPYELTWSDCNDPKYFFIWYPKSGEIEKVLNPYSLFHKILYNDVEEDYEDFDFSNFEGSYIRVIIQELNDNKKFDKFIKRLYDEGQPFDVQVTNVSVAYRDQDLESIETQDPLTVLINAVDESEKDSGLAKKIRREVMNLHTDAMALGVSE